MQVITTTDYPTRYAAQDNPGYLVQQLNTIQQDGYELAAYSHPVINLFDDRLSDGMVANITILGKDFLVQVEATRPSRKREQFNIDGTFATYDVAEEFLIEMIEEGERFIERG